MREEGYAKDGNLSGKKSETRPLTAKGVHQRGQKSEGREKRSGARTLVQRIAAVLRYARKEKKHNG